MKDKAVSSSVAALTIAILSFCAWAFMLPNHLRYQESVQLFCFDGAYLKDLYAFPGGMASLVSGFLTQFFLYPMAGAAIIAGLSMLLFLAVRKACRCSIAMAVVPAVLANALLTDVDFTLSSFIAVLICLCPSVFEDRLRAVPGVGHCLITAALYLLAGPMTVIYPMVLIFRGEVRKGIDSLVIAVAAPALIALLSTYQPWWRFFSGLDYAHSRKEMTLWPMAMPLSIVLAAALSSRQLGRGWFVQALCFIAGIWVSWMCLDRKALEIESLYAYDQSARSGDWEGIISRASKEAPANIPSLVCYNLALAQTGHLGDMLFNVRQSGPQGLFPSYESSYLSMVTGSEALYHAGLVNSAMHYAFEADWAYPDLHQSVRQVLMLQKTNALGGHAEVADRYALLLDKTLFYRFKAIPAVNPGTDGGQLLNDSDDYSKQAMMRELLSEGAANTKTTLDCLLAYDLLCKDLESFADDFDRYWPDGRPVPQCYQEAMMMPYMTGRKPGLEDNPYISQGTKDKAALFIKALRERKGDAYMMSHFGNTYWSYHASNK